MSGNADIVRGRTRGSRGSGGSSAWVALALAAGLLLGGLAMYLATNKSDADPFGGRVNSARYQTVVLSNDKVYFGKIAAAGDEFFQLSDVFFLRETPGATPTDQATRSLLPLNQELQAPENSMLVRRSEVVLVENLDKNSPIQKEITRQHGGK